jgi:hypothetical protein
MDILYILGTGSTWQDNEIRYSLRGIEKNVLDFENVFVVGEKPKWLKNIIHIPASDSYNSKGPNSFSKIKLACEDKRLSNDFLLMNDDFFIFKKISAENYPFYYKGITPSFHSVNFAKVLKNVKNFYNFENHRPFHFKKDLLNYILPIKKLCPSNPIRSLYGNYYSLRGIFSKDLNLMPLAIKSDYDKMLGDRTDISIFSETAKSSVFREWIKEKLPEKSIFEV